MTTTITKLKAREVDNWCRARRGLPYAFGGAFSTNPKDSTDCSGLVLQTGAYLMGRTDWSGNRYGSTESFRLDYKIVSDIGFKRLPACTLFYADQPGGDIKLSTRGIDWESHGGNPGVYYYDGARAWNDPLFHDFWYLDAKLETETAGKVWPQTATDRELLEYIAEQLGPGHRDWPSKGKTLRDKVWELVR